MWTIFESDTSEQAAAGGVHGLQLVTPVNFTSQLNIKSRPR